MIKTIIAFLLRIPSTDHALGAFTKALRELEKVQAAEQAKIESLEAKIEKAASARMDAFTRRDKAQSIAAKVSELVS